MNICTKTSVSLQVTLKHFSQSTLLTFHFHIFVITALAPLYLVLIEKSQTNNNPSNNPQLFKSEHLGSVTVVRGLSLYSHSHVKIAVEEE